jgi:hypothetical protein
MINKFRLTKKESGKSKTVFHVIDEKDGSTIGSISVKNAEASFLLQHWNGPHDHVERQEPGMVPPLMGRMPRQAVRVAVLRGC